MTITVSEKQQLISFIKDYSTQQKITTFPSYQNRTYSINYTSNSKPEIALSWTEIVYPEPPVVKERITHRYGYDSRRVLSDFQTEVTRVQPKIIKRAYYLSIDANDDFILRNEGNESIIDIRKWQTIRLIMQFVPPSPSVSCAFENQRKSSALFAQRLSWAGLILTGSITLISGIVFLATTAKVAVAAAMVTFISVVIAATLGIILLTNIHEYSENPVTHALKPSPVLVTEAAPRPSVEPRPPAVQRTVVRPIRTSEQGLAIPGVQQAGVVVNLGYAPS